MTNDFRQAVIYVRQKLDTSERRTCKVMGLARSTLQYKATPKDDDTLRLAMIRLAKQYGRYGYRKVAKLLRIEGWHVNYYPAGKRSAAERAQEDRASLAGRGPAATAPTPEAQAAISQGQLHHPVASDAPKPRVEYRLRP